MLNLDKRLNSSSNTVHPIITDYKLLQTSIALSLRITVCSTKCYLLQSEETSMKMKSQDFSANRFR